MQHDFVSTKSKKDQVQFLNLYLENYCLLDILNNYHREVVFKGGV